MRQLSAIAQAWRGVIAGPFLVLVSLCASAAELPIFDAHIHYSHDVWDTVPPREAVALLRKAGVWRALVSSSDDDGTQKLLAEAPDLVIRELRPYRSTKDMETWVSDERIIGYVEARLRRYRYVAIGEFHLYGADAERPVVRRLVELARRHGLFLHAHSDTDAIERIFRHDPQARILWAHAGFEPPEKVREMLRRHPNLWCELAFRTDHAPGGQLDPRWRALFMEFPDRFMVGTDTYTADRWPHVIEHARLARQWLAELPRDIAERIAYRNGESLFPKAVTRDPCRKTRDFKRPLTTESHGITRTNTRTGKVGAEGQQFPCASVAVSRL